MLSATNAIMAVLKCTLRLPPGPFGAPHDREGTNRKFLSGMTDPDHKRKLECHYTKKQVEYLRMRKALRKTESL